MVINVENLPGFRYTYRDYNLRLPQEPPGVVTDSVLLIGTAVDGPVNVPYPVTRMDDVDLIFGKMVDANGLPNEMSLVRGAQEAYAAGCRDIRLMRIGGSYATTVLTDELAATLISVKGFYPGSKYNNVAVVVAVSNNVVTVTINKPVGFRGESLSLTSTDYPTIGSLVEAVNKNPQNFMVKFSTNLPETATTELQPDTYQLSGGEDGPVPSDPDYKDQMYALLKDAYDLLVDYDVDFRVPLDVYLDDPTSNGKDFAEQLAQHCAVASILNNTTLGIISAKPVANVELATIAAKVDALCNAANEYYLKDDSGQLVYDEDGNKIDIGRFIVRHAGPEIIFQNNQIGAYAASGVVALAGLISMLPPHHGPVGRTVFGALGLRYSYSRSQLNRLTGARYVTFYVRPGSSSVLVTDGITSALPVSDYRRLTTMRIVAAVADIIRDACEPFFGLPNTPANRGAMATVIEEKLKKLKDPAVGALDDYSFQIFANLRNKLLGEAVIDVTLVPAGEIVKIKSTITLRPTLQQ